MEKPLVLHSLLMPVESSPYRFFDQHLHNQIAGTSIDKRRGGIKRAVAEKLGNQFHRLQRFGSSLGLRRGVHAQKTYGGGGHSTPPTDSKHFEKLTALKLGAPGTRPSGFSQEGGWTPYPTFEELHQILYRSELNIYENFNLPQGVSPGEDGSHVNAKTVEMFKKLLDRPPRFIIEVTPPPLLLLKSVDRSRAFACHLPPCLADPSLAAIQFPACVRWMWEANRAMVRRLEEELSGISHS